MSGELRVNIPELRVGSLGFMDAAESLPEAPTSFPALGTDPLAQALTTRTNEVEAPLSDSLPTTRDSAKTTATNIGTAADKYEQTDQKAQSDVNDRLAEFDSQYGSSSTSGGSTDAMGQFGQLMQMPMQMAQQAVQVPMQMAQQLGQLPQTVMQSVQQLAQMGGGLGQGGAGADAGQAQSAEKGEQQPSADEAGRQDPDERDERDERDEQQQDEQKREGAAAPDSGAQRAPATSPSAPAAPSGPAVAAPPAAPQRPPVDPSVLL
ncbi:hypothetical protein [Mycolicibacterium lutetiense]|uniref:Translation initiation factor IF-2 n=1 Tax=Mycolicibacterium lutetiense TaxID=1641992 RepID=A0ABS5A024_9MYCO|nr:hypothetical protein [Mycolicibacterium lutetiense]MBP2455100.1 hypothetical protein [Mycolicibacterium lutetiense]